MAQDTAQQTIQHTIETILRQKLGLDADSVGSRLIQRAVERRQIACQLTDRAAYLSLLRSSPQELNQLIEAVVVPETWFFRDREPFEYLRQYVKANKGKPFFNRAANFISPDSTLHILSVPCSTGEEPYSIAITLLEAGLKPNQFRVDAVDISEQALIKARAGIYRKKSFRGGAMQNLEHYFQPSSAGDTEGYEVRPIVRESVHFLRGNVLEPHFLLGKQYHAIFCRNLLIYLDEAARRQVIASLDRALLPLGLLFLGAAETAQLAQMPYRSIDHPFAFAYQKELATVTATDSGNQEEPELKEPQTPIVPLKRKDYSFSQIRLAHPPTHSTPVQTSSREGSTPPISPPPHLPTSPLQTAQHLADRGQLIEAAQICESYVRAHPGQAIAYLLLGEIYQGLNQPKQAERCLQKAIYLDPHAYKALIHLALLKEQQGNQIEAARLRRRAQRLAEQEQEQA